MLFDIIIPTCNNLVELKACLDGFACQTNRSFKVFICIDGSTDGTAAYLAQAAYPFEFAALEHPDRRNHGRNAARNLALPHLTAEYLLMVDSDAAPAPDLLDAHYNLLQRHEGVSVGMFTYTNTRDNLWARYLTTRGRNRLPDGARMAFHYFNSGNAAFKRSWFTELGGQDPAMVHYGGGDTEFAVRLFDRYHPPFFNNAKAVVSSAMNKDLAGALDQMIEFGRYNLKHIYKKHPDHRELYGIAAMKKYSWLFALAGSALFARPIAKLLRYAPPSAQLLIVRYLVVINVYRRFSSRDDDGPCRDINPRGNRADAV